MSGLTVGSLFSGIGGLELGVECVFPDARVAWQAEADPAARKVLVAHWPSARRFDDVRRVGENAGYVDLICGGFPCQDISWAGTGAGIDGARSSLWGEFARIICLLRPQFVFVENVGALVARGLDRVLGDLAQAGFDAEWGCFGACEAG